MKLLFIRHAIAIERGEFNGNNDLDRPLSEAGIKKAKLTFNAFSKFYEKPDLIISSEAIRAIDTAKLFNNAYNNKIEMEYNHLLNPGCYMLDLKQIIMPIYNEKKTVVLVGHEPDFYYLISELISDDDVNIVIKKGSIIEVEIDKNF